MQRARSNDPYRYPVRIATFVLALLPAAVMPLIVSMSASAATLDRVKQTGKLTLGYRTDARPFSYRDDSGKINGYAVALCEEVRQKVKSDLNLSSLTVEWVPVTIEDQFQAVQDHKIDLLCGAAETLSNQEHVDFSIPIFPGGIGALLRADAMVGLQDILSGKPRSGPYWRGYPAYVLEKQIFSVVAGSPSEIWLNDQLDKFGVDAKVVPVGGYDAGVRSVLDRNSNVFFADRSILLDAATHSPSAADLKVLERQFTYAPIALALERGDADFRLVVNRTLSQFFGSKSERFHHLYVKWFGEPDAGADMFFKTTLPE